MSENTHADSARNACLATLAQAVLALAVFVLVAFQTYMLTRTHQSLQAAYAGQDKPVEDATKLRQKVESLAGRVAQLAQSGNANAKTIVENFRRQGVEMKPPTK